METELKFQVPEASRAALMKAVATTAVQRTRLQAVYADTPDQRLAAAGLALRLRKEGRVWVQTLKGRGDGLMQRLEHEVPLPAQRGLPQLDPQRHAGTPAGAALAAALAGAGALQPVYRTDILRLHRVVRGAGGALVELAYDSGHIIAGQQRVPVAEIEFELKRGPLAALPLLAARWAERHGLWWDVRTKSERGFRLALGREQVPAVKAAPVHLPPQATPAQAWQAMLLSALQQALPNAAELAGGTGQPEHLHQLRVALRRLRSVLRVFADWSGDAPAAQALEAAWREPFAQLGAARDADVLAQLWRPRLEAAGAPAFDWPTLTTATATATATVVGSGAAASVGGVSTGAACAGPADDRLGPVDPGPVDPCQVVRGRDFNRALLQTLVLVSGAGAPAAGSTGQAAPPLAQAPLLTRAAVLHTLQPLHKRVRRGMARFDDASSDDRHRLRKQLKRLRYALEGVEPLLGGRHPRRLQAALRAALNALGACNDLDAAETAFRAQAQQQGAAWFAAGLAAGLRPQALRQAGKALKRLRKLPLG